MWFLANANDGSIMGFRDYGETVNYSNTLEALANSIDIDFCDILNEGFAIACGNDFAEYQFTALVAGYKYQYRLSHYELTDLLDVRECVFHPFPYVDIEE